MTLNPLNDLVSKQYARWTYPQPILDIPAWLEVNWQWFDPSHAHRLFWPDRPYKADMDILIAGCGANQAAIIAYTNPDAQVVAVDVSQPSLDHHEFLKAKYGLKNLELHLLPIEEVQTLGRDFDLIMSTGVLHHLAIPEKGMAALANCLRSEGVIAVMLYAKFGRVGVEMLQSVFRDIDLRQDDASVLMVKEALKALPADHPIKSYAAIAPDLQYDAGLVDTFLHGRDRCYDIRECIKLVKDSGLVFQDLFLKSSYYPAANSQNPFLEAIAMRPDEQQWSIMERINFRNGCHFFTACRPERSPGNYRVDFKSDDILKCIPMFRRGCGFNGEEVYQHNWKTALGSIEKALMVAADGNRSLGEIVASVINSAGLGASQIELEKVATPFFRSLTQVDIMSMAIGSSASASASVQVPKARKLKDLAK